MQTIVGVNDTKAVRHWSAVLAVDTKKDVYFSRFTGEGENNIIEEKVELTEDAGDTIQFDLSMRIRGGMTYGDNIVEGKEQALTFYQDEVKIDQARLGVSGGGRMTRKRTLHDLRKVMKDRAADYMSEWLDELHFLYLSGDAAFGANNADKKISTPLAGNPVQAPDGSHITYGGTGAVASKAALTAADKMSVALIERASVMPTMMSAENPDVVNMSPVKVDGAKRFVMLMNPWQAHDLRTETGDLSWSKIQQAMATSEGRNSPICKGGLGMINDVVLHKHENVLRFGDYGAGANVPAARALLLGRQAGVIAYGAAGSKARFSWVEKMFDADNQVAIYPGVIVGMKKTRFNGSDFGVIAVDTAARNPNAA